MAHALIAAVSEASREPSDRREFGSSEDFSQDNDHAYVRRESGRSGLDSGRTARLIEAAGWTPSESLTLSLADYATLASSAEAADADWIASASSRLGDPDLALEMAGVVFAFNTLNRVADARRLQLEYRFLRGLKPVRGWMERRFADLTGLVYDLSHVHRKTRSTEDMLRRLGALFKRLSAASMLDLLGRLTASPLVLEGIDGMIEVNLEDAGIHPNFWKEAGASAMASRAMPSSGLLTIVDQWLSRSSLPDAKTLLSLEASPGSASQGYLVSARRRSGWRVSNAAYTITEEHACKFYVPGFSDAEVVDLTIAVAMLSALSIVVSLIVAADPARPE